MSYLLAVAYSSWVADRSRPRCSNVANNCNNEFGVFSHLRHHCRVCGELFCSDCVQLFFIQRAAVDGGRTVNEFVCTECIKSRYVVCVECKEELPASNMHDHKQGDCLHYNPMQQASNGITNIKHGTSGTTNISSAPPVLCEVKRVEV